MVINGDCLEVLKTLESNSIDSLITDPPAGISFMGKSWDSDKGGRDHWIKWMSEVMCECLRVLKPGAHGLVWSLPRTSHWTATACEDAGFEIRDCVSHLFGSGFPKSLNIAKQFGKQYQCRLKKNVKLAQKQSGLFQVELPGEKIVSVLVNAPIPQEDDQEKKMVIGAAVILNDKTGISLYESTEIIDSNTLLLWKNQLDVKSHDGKMSITLMELEMITGLKIWNCLRFPNTLDIMQLNEGQGTALKPAVEMWWLIRKPLSEKTVAENVLKWGTGGINIDGCRIEAKDQIALAKNWDRIQSEKQGIASTGLKSISQADRAPTGRFPANLVLSHSPYCQDDQCNIECAIALLDGQSGVSKSSAKVRYNSPSPNLAMSGKNLGHISGGHDDSGGGARFFYCAKVSPSERNAGLGETKNIHPTLKPQKLMRYFCRLITPPNGIILDPFMGSGSTGLAAKSEGFQFIGIEKEKEYFEIAEKRIG